MKHLAQYIFAWAVYLAQEIRSIPSDIKTWLWCRKKNRIMDRKLERICDKLSQRKDEE